MDCWHYVLCSFTSQHGCFAPMSKVRPKTTLMFIGEKHVFCHCFFIYEIHLKFTYNSPKSGLLPEDNASQRDIIQFGKMHCYDIDLPTFRYADNSITYQSKAERSPLFCKLNNPVQPGKGQGQCKKKKNAGAAQICP